MNTSRRSSALGREFAVDMASLSLWKWCVVVRCLTNITKRLVCILRENDTQH